MAGQILGQGCGVSAPYSAFMYLRCCSRFLGLERDGSRMESVTLPPFLRQVRDSIIKSITCCPAHLPRAPDYMHLLSALFIYLFGGSHNASYSVPCFFNLSFVTNPVCLCCSMPGYVSGCRRLFRLIHALSSMHSALST